MGAGAVVVGGGVELGEVWEVDGVGGGLVVGAVAAVVDGGGDGVEVGRGADPDTCGVPAPPSGGTLGAIIA